MTPEEDRTFENPPFEGAMTIREQIKSLRLRDRVNFKTRDGEGSGSVAGLGYDCAHTCVYFVRVQLDGTPVHSSGVKLTEDDLISLAADKPKEPIKIEVISGPEGPCLAVNDTRVAGPKPWGGGTVLYSFLVDPVDLEEAGREG